MKLAAVNFSVGGWKEETPEQKMNDPYRLALKTLSDMNRTVICVAAGNETHEVGVPSPDFSDRGVMKGYYVYPPSYKGIDNMIVVAAAESDLTRASFSNYGRHYVDVAAPGGDIFSTRRSSASEDLKYDSVDRLYPYTLMSGTSMAAPHVTGVAGLLKAIFPDANASEIKAAILGGANGEYLRDDGTSRHGLIDIRGAIEFMNASRSQNSAPVISPVSIDEAIVNQPCNIEFYASGTQTITWSIEGELPEGMTFDESTAKITGTPLKEGAYSFIVTAENDYGYDSLVLDISVGRGIVPVITEDEELSTLEKSTEPLSFDINTKGSWPVTYSIESTNMPESFKLSINSDTGIGSLIPAETGRYSFTVKASNYAGSDTKTLTLTVTEESKNLPVIQTSELKSAFKGMPYGLQGVVDIGSVFLGISDSFGCKVSADSAAGISWNVTGLPEGLNFETVDKKTINITGIPITAGSFDVHITAENKYGTDSKDYVLSVENKAPEFFTSPQIPQRGIYINLQYIAIGSRPLSFSVSGDIPDGLNLTFGENTVNCEGVPTKTGTYEFDLYASNDFGRDSVNVLVNVTEPAYITTYFRQRQVI